MKVLYFCSKLSYALSSFWNNLAAHLERSPLNHSFGYGSAVDLPTCFANLPQNSGSRYETWARFDGIAWSDSEQPSEERLTPEGWSHGWRNNPRSPATTHKTRVSGFCFGGAGMRIKCIFFLCMFCEYLTSLCLYDLVCFVKKLGYTP